MRKTIIIAGVAIGIICAALIFYGFIKFTQRDAIPSRDLTLSDYPKLFAKEAVIVIGENASQIEKESAEAIAANLENLTGNKPKIYIPEKIESFKYTYNLIIVGTPNSNKILEEVYNMTDATRVTDEYPGENRGVLEILRNPWNEEKAMLLVEGSDEWGVKAVSMELEQILELNKASVVMEWEESEADKRLSKMDAYDLVISQVLNGSTEGKLVYVSSEPVKAGTIIESWYSSIELPQKEGWFFFVDDHPSANWEHPCRYVFVDLTGKMTVYKATTPPNNLMELEGVVGFNAR